MTISRIITGLNSSFHSLIDVIELKIDFAAIEEWQIKIVIEGRREAFTTAASQLNMIKDLEQQEDIFELEEYEIKSQKLIDSTDDLSEEIFKALKMPIEAQLIEDEKFKSIVGAKKIGGEFLIEIERTKAEMKFNLENRSSEDTGKRKDFASETVKGGK